MTLIERTRRALVARQAFVRRLVLLGLGMLLAGTLAPQASAQSQTLLLRLIQKIHLTAHYLIGFASTFPSIADRFVWVEALERENVTLEGSHTDMQFLAGRSVRISADVADDVFAAGRDVTFDGATAQNTIIAGYDVEQRSGTVADMIAAGATIEGEIRVPLQIFQLVRIRLCFEHNYPARLANC